MSVAELKKEVSRLSKAERLQAMEWLCFAFRKTGGNRIARMARRSSRRAQGKS